MSAKATDDQVLAISKGYYIIYRDKNTGKVDGWLPQTLRPTISRDVADRYEEGEKPEAFSMAWVNTLLTPSPRRTLEDMNWILKSLSEVGDMDTTSIRVFTPVSQEDAAVFRDTLGVEESRAVSFASMVKYLAENPEDLELLFCWYMKYSSTQPDLLARMLVASKAASRENLLFMARSWSGKMELRGKKIIHALENPDVVLLDPMDVLVNEIVSGSFYVEVHDHQIISTISKSPELTSDRRAKTAVQEWFGPILDKGYLSDADLVASREGGYLSGFERNCLLALQRRGFLEKGTKALDVGSISLRALEWPTGHTLEDAHLVFPDDNEMKRGLASLLAHVKAHPEDFHLLIRFAASRTDVDIIPKLVKSGVISRDDVVGSLSNLRGKGESALQFYVSSLEAKFAKIAAKAYRRNLMKLTESRWVIHSMGSHGSMFLCSGLSEEKAQKWLADLGLDRGSEVITKERLLECRNRVASSFDEIAIVRALISDSRVEDREESFKTFYVKPDEYFGLRQPTIDDLNYTSKFRDQSNKLGWSLAASIHATLSEGTIGAKDILEASSSYFNDVCEIFHFLSEAGSDVRAAIVDDLMSSTRPDIVAVGVKLNEKFRVADSDFDQAAKDLRESSELSKRKGKEVSMTNTTESNTFKKGVVDDKLDTSNWGPIGGFGPKIVTLADLENFLSVPVTFLGNYGFVTASLAAEEAERVAKELLYLFAVPPGTRTLSNADVWGWMDAGDSSTTDGAKKIALCCLAREGYLRDNWAEYLEVKYIKDILPRAKTMDLPAMRSLFQENGLGFEMEDFGVNLTVYLRMMESQDKIPDLVSAVGGIGDSLFEKRAEVLGLIVREMVRHGGLSVSRLEQSIQQLTAHQSATLQNVGASIRLLAQAVDGAKFKSIDSEGKPITSVVGLCCEALRPELRTKEFTNLATRLLGAWISKTIPDFQELLAAEHTTISRSDWIDGFYRLFEVGFRDAVCSRDWACRSIEAISNLHSFDPDTIWLLDSMRDLVYPTMTSTFEPKVATYFTKVAGRLEARKLEARKVNVTEVSGDILRAFGDDELKPHAIRNTIWRHLQKGTSADEAFRVLMLLVNQGRLPFEEFKSQATRSISPELAKLLDEVIWCTSGVGSNLSKEMATWVLGPYPENARMTSVSSYLEDIFQLFSSEVGSELSLAELVALFRPLWEVESTYPQLFDRVFEVLAEERCLLPAQFYYLAESWFESISEERLESIRKLRRDLFEKQSARHYSPRMESNLVSLLTRRKIWFSVSGGTLSYACSQEVPDSSVVRSIIKAIPPLAVNQATGRFYSVKSPSQLVTTIHQSNLSLEATKTLLANLIAMGIVSYESIQKGKGISFTVDTAVESMGLVLEPAGVDERFNPTSNLTEKEQDNFVEAAFAKQPASLLNKGLAFCIAFVSHLSKSPGVPKGPMLAALATDPAQFSLTLEERNQCIFAILRHAYVEGWYTQSQLDQLAVELEPSIAERVRGLVKKDILDPKADSKDGVDVEAKRAFAEANRQLIQYLKTEDWFFTGDELVGLPGMENGKAEKIAEVVGLLKVTTGQRDPASSAKVVESLTQLTKGQIGHVKKIVTTLLRLGIEPDAVVMKEIFQSEKIELLPHGTREEDWELANEAFPGTVISQQVASVAAYFRQCGRGGLVPQLAKLIHCDTDTTHWLPKLIHVSIDRGILDADKILDYARNVLMASANIHEYSFGSELEDYLTHRSGKTASKEAKGDDMTPGMAALQYLHRSKGEVKVALQKEVDEGRQTEIWRDKVIAHLTSEEEYQRNLEAVVADALRDFVGQKNTPETGQAIVDAAVTRLVSMFEQDPPSVEPIGHVADSAIRYEEMYRQIHYAYERKVHRRPVQHPAESYRKLMDLESEKLNYLFGSESLKKAVSAVDQALNPGVVSPSERVSMEKKAAKCLAIAQWMYGNGANVKELEDKAFALMDLPYHHIESLHNHIKTKVGSLDTGKAAVDAVAALSSVGKAAVGVGAAMLGAMSETTTDEIEDVKAKVKAVKGKMTPKTTMGSAKVKASSAMEEEFEEEEFMDDPLKSDEDGGGSKTNVGQILIRTLKDDGKTIALRTGVKHTREQLTSLVTNFINSKSIRRYEGESDEAYAARAEAQRSGVSAFLLSDVGQQVITYLLGLSWPVLEDNIEDKRVRKYGGMVAAEIRAQSGSDLLDGFLEEVVFPLLAVITAEAKNFGKMVLAPAKKVRVQPHFGESVEDEKARLMERLAELEREANVVPLAKNRQ